MVTLARELAQAHGAARAVIVETDANFLCRELYAKAGFMLEDGAWTSTRELLPSLPPHIRMA